MDTAAFLRNERNNVDAMLRESDPDKRLAWLEGRVDALAAEVERLTKLIAQREAAPLGNPYFRVSPYPAGWPYFYNEASPHNVRFLTANKFMLGLSVNDSDDNGMVTVTSG